MELIFQGGGNRSESVMNGLKWIYNQKESVRRVLCLEAARPLVTRKQIEMIVNSDSPSCCFVNPVVDTVILKDKTYLNRSECLHIVSPQAFDFKLLYNAYQNCKIEEERRTDDTRLMYDTYGIEPDFLDGGDNLYKVTYPKDISVLEEIWKVLQKEKSY